MRTLVAFLLFAMTGSAQLLSFGIRGGVPLTDAYSTVTMLGSNNTFVKQFSNSKEYEIGPMVELHLPLGLAVEADALYHPLNLTTETSGGFSTPGFFVDSTNFSSWEFPILAKYHILPLPLVKPYVEGGPVFRALAGRAALSNLSNAGIALGGGVEIKIARLRIEPEIRYTRWGSDTGGAAGNGFPPSNVNQAAILLGIAF